MRNKNLILICAIVLSLAITVGGVMLADNNDTKPNTETDTADVSSTVISNVLASPDTETLVSDVASSDASSSSIETSSNAETSSKLESSKPSSSNTTTSSSDNPITNTLFPGYKYNSVFDIEDNVFLDALKYTGYNLEKHRKDGKMWQYILSSDKKWRGWLSNITYGGGSLGTETTSDGLPNIKAFERGGLVCASFATYVYFNYLPNIAKIDTSCLDLPEKTWNAQSFYLAAQKWLKKGYTYNIGFTAKNRADGIEFHPDEEIPIGSIIVFRDLDSPGKTEADHITIYVGKKNGYHWVIQTGNKNGPEFCAVERFKFGPDPQWPLKIFATPTCIYDAVGETTNAPAVKTPDNSVTSEVASKPEEAEEQ